MGPPPACCDSNSGTVEPTANSWPLALGLLPPTLGSNEGVLQGLPLPPLGPQTLLLLLLLLLHRSL